MDLEPIVPSTITDESMYRSVLASEAVFVPSGLAHMHFQRTTLDVLRKDRTIVRNCPCRSASAPANNWLNTSLNYLDDLQAFTKRSK